MTAPGQPCPTCGRTLIEHNSRVHCAKCNTLDGASSYLFGEAIAKALQREPETEVVRASWNVDEEERARLAEHFRTKGIL
jgi:uncharacterized Zn finger protein (UPF0148 family)